MSDLAGMGRVLVAAPHPDDEVLGCGGVMARLAAEGHEVHVLVATRGKPPAFSAESVAQVRAEMGRAHKIIGIAATHELDFPAAAMDTVPGAEINAEVGRVIAEVEPDTLFLPFPGDIHFDHAILFQSAMVAARPRHDKAPGRVFCYETLSETNWYAPPTTPAFMPNLFIDISATLETKLEAFRAFNSQVRPFPEERSVEAITALARMRGAIVHRDAAEAFVTIRQILR